MYIERHGFLAGLHVLRGLAALSTVFFHLRFMSPTFHVNYFSFVDQFGAGVTLFFILSCFSLIHSTSRKLEHKNWVAGYVYRRIFRIYPLFFGMLLFHLLYHYFIFGKTYPLSEIWINTLILYQFYPGQHASIVWAGWTIGVEVTFYCLFPLLFSISRSITFWTFLFALTFLVSMQIPNTVELLELDNSYAYMSFPRQLFVFIFGGVIYLVADKYGTPFNKKISLMVSIILFIIWALLAKGLISIFDDSYFLALKVWAIGLLIYYFYDNKYLYNKFTGFLGEVSYTVYLIHPVVIALFKPYLIKIYHVGLPNDIAFFFSFIIIFAIVCSICLFVNKYFEMPIYYYGVNKAKLLES